MEIMGIMADATNMISEGEAKQKASRKSRAFRRRVLRCHIP